VWAIRFWSCSFPALLSHEDEEVAKQHEIRTKVKQVLLDHVDDQDLRAFYPADVIRYEAETFVAGALVCFGSCLRIVWPGCQAALLDSTLATCTPQLRLSPRAKLQTSLVDGCLGELHRGALGKLGQALPWGSCTAFATGAACQVGWITI
jgi:hypothetical protein